MHLVAVAGLGTDGRGPVNRVADGVGKSATKKPDPKLAGFLLGTLVFLAVWHAVGNRVSVRCLGVPLLYPTNRAIAKMIGLVFGYAVRVAMRRRDETRDIPRAKLEGITRPRWADVPLPRLT